MAPATLIQACIVPPDGTIPTLRYIPTVTKPCTLPPILDGLTPSKEAALVPDKLRTTHFLYFDDDHASQPTYRLPNTQPECPKQWTHEAWNKRYVIGNTQFHLFCTSVENTATIILKVSKAKDHKDYWVYDDFEPDSKMNPNALGHYVTHLKFDIRMQMEAAKVI